MKRVESKKSSAGQHEELIAVLKARFEANRRRHKGLEWPPIMERLEANPEDKPKGSGRETLKS